MQIARYEKQYAAQIAELLNNYMPFQPEDAKTVDEAGGIRYIALIDGEVVGYIAGYVIEQAAEEFPYFDDELTALKMHITEHDTLYASHFVVNPNYRKRGIGSQLVEAFMTEAKTVAETIVVVGWVQSDTNTWAAERQFLSQGFTSYRYIKRYFEPYNVYCPNCNGTCYCDAHIVIQHVHTPATV